MWIEPLPHASSTVGGLSDPGSTRAGPLHRCFCQLIWCTQDKEKRARCKSGASMQVQVKRQEVKRQEREKRVALLLGQPARKAGFQRVVLSLAKY